MISIIFLIFNTTTSYAFNYSHCSKKVGFGGNGIGLYISTTSYVSSTGPCAAIAKIEDQKKNFIANNLDRLIDDSSKGNGEYLNAYLLLSGCSLGRINEAELMIQKNLQIIYGNDLDLEPEESFKSLNFLLLKHCGNHTSNV